MGITARGAWESVKRHFRELGARYAGRALHRGRGRRHVRGRVRQRHAPVEDDLSGGGVRSPPRLHRSGPRPRGLVEGTARLFALPRSSWDDYDKTLISEGGGIWPRSAKSIRLSARAREVLGIEAESLSPAELIRCILKAPVDLLYNGGIGTYVKGSSETDASVGDRANEAVRVTGAELRCRVIGEGGNLGITQLGRIEFALKGGKVNTDAIDNSGGVDCSDHEVNIKILLDSVVAEGELTMKQRNKLLADMTEEVAALVLRDNYAQTQVLSVTQARGVAMLDEQSEYIRTAESCGASQSKDRVPAHGRGDRRAQGRTHRSGPARACGRAGLQQDRAVRRGACLRRARGPLHLDRAGALFSEAAAGSLRAADRAASAQARDHRDARGQQHDQSRRQHLREPLAGRGRRFGARYRARLHGRARSVRPGARPGARSKPSTTRSRMPYRRR
jgi:glutamate dehydrogenase